MKRRIVTFCKFGAPLLVVTGLACSFIPWGEPDQFHGEGFPVPSMMWDHANRYDDDPSIPDSKFIDFPNPLALLLNPLLFVLGGFFAQLIIELAIRLWTHLR